MNSKADIGQQTLALMVLKALETHGPVHAYGIARHIEQISGGRLSVDGSTLYPTLLKLEQEGYIAHEWGASGNNREVKLYGLKTVPAQTGLALENEQLIAVIAEQGAQRAALNREIEIAREVQQRLFPQELPVVSGLTYFGTCRPALGVGGDYYDFLELPDGKLGVVIGDVSGKGISAALTMASVQASLRSQMMGSIDDLGSVVARTNRVLYDTSSPDRYATLFLAIYDPALHILKYVNAGHIPPILAGKSRHGCVARLDSGGTVIGLLRDVAYEQAIIKLDEGSTLLAFTDGITETTNTANEEWGEERLFKSFRECDGLAPDRIVAKIVAGADQFAAGTKQHDDMTVVILQVEERP